MSGWGGLRTKVETVAIVAGFSIVVCSVWVCVVVFGGAM